MGDSAQARSVPGLGARTHATDLYGTNILDSREETRTMKSKCDTAR